MGKRLELSDFQDSINNRLITVRKALKISSKNFADSIKISRNYLSEIECGKRKVNDRIIKLIALNFGVNEDWLKTGEGEMFADTEDPRLRQIISNFQQLDSFLQDYLVRQLDWMVKAFPKEE
ncbi:MAG: helix-turn-helix domain-containing protein [Spirochaetaceae bacterium]|jgi:transcriptional regulator with XRE-family HTH domain|nr:helix-turn-helix domain-containing protein [Spirochaetaceae bacterium]